MAEDRCLLCEVAHSHLRPFVDRQFGNLLRVAFVLEKDLSVVGLDESHDHVKGGGLSRTVRPQQADDLALVDVDGYVVDHGACLVFLDQSGGVEPHFFEKTFLQS